MNELSFKALTRDSASFTKLKEIFDEAFPLEEVNLPFEEYVALSETMECIHALEIDDGDTSIGFFLYVDADEYSYLNYFAVDSSQRGHGYGQRALAMLLDSFSDKILLADIECPIEGEDGYEIKLRRQRFYERNGFLVSKEPYTCNGMQFLVISNEEAYLDAEYIFRLKDIIHIDQD